MTSPFLGGPLAPAPVRAGAGPRAWRVRPRDLSGASAPEGVAALARARRRWSSPPAQSSPSWPRCPSRRRGPLAGSRTRFRGATLAELHVAPIRQRESASGDLLAQWVVVLAAWAGADRLLVRGLLGSFAVARPRARPFAAGAAASELVLRGAAELLSCAVGAVGAGGRGRARRRPGLSLAARPRRRLAAAAPAPRRAPRSGSGAPRRGRERRRRTAGRPAGAAGCPFGALAAGGAGP